MQRSQPHFESTTITGVYPCPVTGAFRLCYSGRFPVSLCGSEDHSPLRSRAGFSARPTCSLERCSMTTIPRHCLVRFADYKQKDLAVNGKINFWPGLSRSNSSPLTRNNCLSFLPGLWYESQLHRPAQSRCDSPLRPRAARDGNYRL